MRGGRRNWGERERERERERKRARQDKAGSGEKLNTVSVVCVKGGLGTNTCQSVRVSCAAPCSMPASSILSLSSQCAQWHWESTHSNTWSPQRSASPLLRRRRRQHRTGRCGTPTPGAVRTGPHSRCRRQSRAEKSSAFHHWSKHLRTLTISRKVSV